PQVLNLRHTPTHPLRHMGKQRPDLPIFRRAREPGDCSSSRRLGSERRTRMALLASPDVGIRGRALLKNRRIDTQRTNMTASTVAQYLAALPADRRAALSAVRKAINE